MRIPFRPCAWTAAGARHSPSAASATRSRRRIHPLGRADFPRRARHQGPRHRALSAHRERRRTFRSTCTPIHIDPEQPALPISHPVLLRRLSGEAAGLLSPPLGMAEDTWALNEGVIDEDAFLQQAYLTSSTSAQAMFLNALETHPARRGGLRFRYQRPRAAHVLPPPKDSGGPACGRDRRLYRRMDALVGNARCTLDARHRPVRALRPWLLRLPPGCELNSWLRDNGYWR